MTGTNGHTQTHGPQPEDCTTEVEPLVPLSTEQTNRIVIASRHCVAVNHYLDWTRSRYTKRYIALGP